MAEWSYEISGEIECASWAGGVFPDLKMHFHRDAQLSVVTGGKRSFSTPSGTFHVATVITTISVAVFISAGAVAWPQAVCVLIGALIGGYAGARLARVIPARLLKGMVIATGLFLSGYYFLIL